MNEPRDIADVKLPSTFEEQTKGYDKLRDQLRPGTASVGPRFAGPPSREKPNLRTALKATLEEGVTASLFTGLSVNEGDIDPDYIPTIEPQYQAFASVILKSPNEEETARIKADIDVRNENLRIMSERPGAAFVGQFLDPTNLAIDAATFGLGAVVSIPLAANAARRTESGLALANQLKNLPRTERFIKEGAIGAHGGAAAVSAQIGAKAATDELETTENLAEHALMGAALGVALGGGISLLTKGKAAKLTKDTNDAIDVGNAAARAPDEFSPLKTAQGEETNPLKTAQQKDFGIRAEAEAPKRMTPEEIKAKAKAIREEVDAELPVRATGYAHLREQFMQIGENLNKNVKVPKIINKALSVISAPIRNLSAANRLLNKPFGTGRMFTMGMVRNATEFAGTRQGLVLPRSAQNRIEDLWNQGTSVSLDIQLMLKEANNVKDGPFAFERMALGDREYAEQAFFDDVGTQMLHVGRPTEFSNNVNPVVQKAAKHAYDKFYKPMGDLLKEYGLIPDNGTIEDTLNYLNRLWSTNKIIENPEGFKSWLANEFSKQNQELKSLMPTYEQGLKNARELNRDASRFEKAADEIDALTGKVEKNEVENKIKEAEKTLADKTKEIEKKYSEQKEAVDQKYERLAQSPDLKIPSLPSLKAEVKEEIRAASNEQENILKSYHNDRNAFKSDIKSKRKELKEIKRSILRGNRDYEIKQELADQFVEQYAGSADYRGYSLDEIKKIAHTVYSELDEASISVFRKNLVSDYQLETINAVSELRTKIYALDKRHAESQTIFKSDLKKDLADTLNALEDAGKKTGKEKGKADRGRILESRKKVELKLIDLKQAHAKFKADKAANDAVSKLSEPLGRLEYLQKKYSRAGLEAFYTRKAAERMAPNLKSQARAAERKALKSIEPDKDARAISEELREGAQIEAQRAQDVIPDRLRSSKTGLPRRTWDEELEPTYAYDRADQTMRTILGQEDDIVYNPILSSLGGGEPGMFKPRALKFSDDTPGIEQWVDRDIRVLMDNFSRGIAPPIALTELMHQLNEIPLIRQTVKRMNAAKTSLSEKRLAEAPDTIQHYSEIPGVFATMMREEFQLLSEGLSGKPLQALLEDYHAAEKEMDTIWKQIKGVFGQGLNVNSSKASDFFSIFNSAASTVTTTNLGISMLTETMTPATAYGFKKHIVDNMLPLLKSSGLRSMAKNQLKAMYIANKVQLGSIIKSRISGRPNSLKNSGFGRFASNLANRLGNITFANKVQEFNELQVGTLSAGNVLSMAENVFKRMASSRELTYLAQRSISPEKAKKIYELWKKYGWEKEGVKGIDPGDLESMSPADAKAWSYFSGFVNDDMKTILARPGVGSLPNIHYTPYGDAILFLRRWFFANTNDTVIPAIQRADKEAVQGFMGMLAIGALQSEIRKLYRGEEQKEFNLEAFVFDALSNSGSFGIYSFGVDVASASGLVAGVGGSRFDPSGGLASYIGGPGVIGWSGKTLGILGRLAQISRDEDKQFTYKEFNLLANQLLPMYKWAPISSVVKPNVREYFESIDRGGK